MRVRTMRPFDAPASNAAPVEAETPPSAPPSAGGPLRMIEKFRKDDYILLGIIAVLFFEGCEDYALLAALGYIFVMGIL